MNLKKLLACGVLLGLLTTVSLAQRGRLSNGGALPGARLPNATTHVQINHADPNVDRVTPNASKTGAQPDAVGVHAAKNPKPNADRVPNSANRVSNRVITPDANDVSDRIAVGPIK